MQQRPNKLSMAERLSMPIKAHSGNVTLVPTKKVLVIWKAKGRKDFKEFLNA